MCYACRRPNCRQVFKKFLFLFHFSVVGLLETKTFKMRASERPLGNVVTILNLLIPSLLPVSLACSPLNL